MLIFVSFVIMASTLAYVMLSAAFRLSLKREAPHLFEALKTPAAMMAFTFTLLSHRYRVALADYPRSRAWASWLFAVQWIQLGAFILLTILIFNR